MKILILFSLTALFLSGCASDGLYTAAGAASAGAIGGALSKGNPLITGASAAGGALASELVISQVKDAKDAARKEGYELGRSDAVKQQYWIVQNQQKNLKTGYPPQMTYLPITTGGTNANGTTTVPTTEYIPIETKP